jgi:hypothetical protein
MDAVQYLHAWVIGETMQGRAMIAAGVLLSISAFFIFKSENLLLRGMLIPVVLLVAMNLGYGSVLILRPSTSQKTETALLQNRAQAVDREIQKTIKDAR